MIFPNWAPNFPFTKRNCFPSHLWIFWQREASSSIEVLNGNDAKDQQKEPGSLLWWSPGPVFQLLVLPLAPSSQFFFHLPWQWEQSWHGELEGLGMGCTSVPSEQQQHFRSLPADHWAELPPHRSRVLKSLEWEGNILRLACTAASIRGLKIQITPW